MSLVNSEWLETFLTFSQTLNLTRAAKQRHLSQPAVHMQIKKLSEQFGSPLYRKTGRRLELTEAGRQVAGFAADLRDQQSALVERLHSDVSNRSVILAAGEGAYLYLLGKPIQDFSATATKALRLLTSDRDSTLNAVATGAAHLGVTVLETPAPGLLSEILAEVPLSLVLPHDHRLAKARRVRLTDLSDARLILPPADRPHRMLVAQALRSAGTRWSLAAEANGWELMLHFASLGLGWTIVNGCCDIPEGLVSVPIVELPRTTYYVVSRLGPLHPEVSRLKRLMLASTAKWRRRS